MEDINELCQYDSEYEWFEFKENWYKPDELGEYKSAISNIRIWSGKENLMKFPEKESYLFNILYGFIERIGPNKSGYWKVVNVDI